MDDIRTMVEDESQGDNLNKCQVMSNFSIQLDYVTKFISNTPDLINLYKGIIINIMHIKMIIITFLSNQ